jgi:hypothetical protein
MTSDLHFKMRRWVAAVFLLFGWIVASNSAIAESWRSLTPMQREALAPLVQQWDILPELQRQRLLKTAEHYPKMTPEQKKHYHERLPLWTKLPPEKRNAAREKYGAFKKVPTEKQEQVKRMVKEDQAKKGQLPASGVVPVTSSK